MYYCVCISAQINSIDVGRKSWGNAEAGAKPKIAIAPTWQVMVAICPWWFEALVYTSNICLRQNNNQRMFSTRPRRTF